MYNVTYATNSGNDDYMGCYVVVYIEDENGKPYVSFESGSRRVYLKDGIIDKLFNISFEQRFIETMDAMIEKCDELNEEILRGEYCLKNLNERIINMYHNNIIEWIS